MTRDEWIAELRGLLERRGVPASEVADALEYYAEAIDDRVELGLSERQALEEIGSPAQACDAVAAELSARDGVEVHGIDAKQGKVVVTVEADGIDESHRIASDFVSIDTVCGVDLVYANFEDDNLGK